MPSLTAMVRDEDIPSIQRSIEEMRCAQEEQRSLLQNFLQQWPKDLKAVEHLALLVPMQQCLLSIQSKLQDMSHAPVSEQQAHALASPMDVPDYHLMSTMGKSNSKLDDFVPDVENDLLVTSPGGSSACSHQKGVKGTAHHGAARNNSTKNIEIDLIETRKIKKMLHGAEEIGEELSDKIVNKVEAWLKLWSSIEIPQYNNCVYRLVNSQCFLAICLLVIILNAILIAATADWQIQHVGQDPPQLLDILEKSFTTFFLVELIFRLLAHRIYFFLNNDMLWNIFDLVLVIISVVGVIFQYLIGSQATGNVSFMRMMKLFKLARILRSLRTFFFFKSLGLMLHSLGSALVTVFWGWVLLIFTLYLFASIYLHALIDYLHYSDGVDADLLQLMDTRFGSFPKVVVSLYMSVSGGEDWALYYDTMMKAGAFYALLYLLFTFFFHFALLNIVTALVVEKAMCAGEPDRCEEILKRRRQLEERRQELVRICHSIDIDNNGRVSYKEFAKWSARPEMRHFMESLGLDITDVKLFFSQVGRQDADGTGFNQGEVSIQTFVEGCLNMQGNATAVDMQKQLYEMDILLHNVQHLDMTMSHRLRGLETALAALTCSASMSATKS